MSAGDTPGGGGLNFRLAFGTFAFHFLCAAMMSFVFLSSCSGEGSSSWFENQTRAQSTAKQSNVLVAIVDAHLF